MHYLDQNYFMFHFHKDEKFILKDIVFQGYHRSICQIRYMLPGKNWDDQNLIRYKLLVLNLIKIFQY